MRFDGCLTAIVTPFKGTEARSKLDFSAYRKLVEFQDENGISGIVACGTTGESPVLSHEEHNDVVKITVENSKNPVIAGTGSNSTWEAIEMTRHAENIGADASLQVCPYYNKPSQEGLFRHFGAIAEAVDIPIILYNVPGRTSREIAPDTMVRLSDEYSNIIGVKEASGKEEVWKRIREVCSADFLLLSGNDGDTCQMMRDYDAKGVISVASNLIPKEMAELIRLGLDGNFSKMEEGDARLRKLFDVLFIDSNPIPVKEAMNMIGLNAGGYRLPMCETTDENRERIRAVLNDLGIIDRY